MEKGELRFLEFICYNRCFAKDQYRPSIVIFGKGPIKADELGGIWVLHSPEILSILIYKIAKNTKINHIMVSFASHYNAIFTDRLPSKTKIGKCSWYFNNSLICKSEVSSATKTFLFLLKYHTQVQLQWTAAFKSGSCRLRFS